jgi:cytoskeletal protein CcmA (bactofilin family)
MTTIGPSLIITGEVTSQEDITIHGRVNGQIVMDEGSLLVAPKGALDANVEGSHVTIHGTVVGNVVASDRVELTATAAVTGTLTTSTIVLQDGATFNGTIDMDRQSAGKKSRIKPVSEVAKAS